MADDAVHGEEPEKQGREDHEGQVQADEVERDGEGGNGGGGSQDEEDVEDVAAHDVTQGDVGLSGQCGFDADSQLRCAGAEGHHGETDDEGRDTQGGGDAGSASNQQFRAGQKKN